MSSEDFLSGKIPDIEKKDLKIGLEEHKHRLNLQKSIFSSVVSLAVALYMTAISIGGFVVYLISKDSTLHWHASVLVAAFVIPPTILLVALIRGIFSEEKEKEKEKEKSKEDNSFNLPVNDVYKEIIKKSLDSVVKNSNIGRY